MTRIISGFAGSIALHVPASGTRPTSDRVREAIFSALDARDELDGARVVDLYAGSGALGLEAVSRGAASAVLVERSATAAKSCRRNADAVLRAAPGGAGSRGAPTVRVVSQAVQGFLDASGETWDVALIDPPYDLSSDELAAALVSLVPRLAPDATVMVERRTKDAAPEWPAGLELERAKAYGDTTLYWLSAAPSVG